MDKDLFKNLLALMPTFFFLGLLIILIVSVEDNNANYIFIGVGLIIVSLLTSWFSYYMYKKIEKKELNLLRRNNFNVSYLHNNNNPLYTSQSDILSDTDCFSLKENDSIDINDDKKSDDITYFKNVTYI